MKVGLYLLLITLTSLSSSVFAHAGSHAELSSWEQVAHYLSQPYHVIGIILVAGALTGLVLWRHWHRR